MQAVRVVAMARKDPDITFDVNVATVGQALSRELKAVDQVEGEYPEIKAKLLSWHEDQDASSSGSTIDDAEPLGAAASERTIRRASRRGLVAMPSEHRPKTLDDTEKLVFLETVRAKDHELAASFKPRMEASGAFMRYLDPMEEFLEESERNGRDGHNYIRITVAEFRKSQADGKPPRWRSNELLRKCEQKLGSLWLAPLKCRWCWQPLTMGLREEVKLVLSGAKELPGTDTANRRKRFRYPEAHPWCEAIQAELVMLEVVLQDHEGDDPEAIAYRADHIQQLVENVRQRFEEDGLEVDAIVKYLRHNLRVIEQIGKKGS